MLYPPPLPVLVRHDPTYATEFPATLTSLLCCCCSTPPQGVNWKFFAKQFSAWVATLFLVGGTTALIFAQGVYSPCKPQASQVMFYEDRAANLSMSMFKSFNSSLATYQTPAMAGNLTQLSAGQFKNLSVAVNYYYVNNKLAVNPSVNASGGWAAASGRGLALELQPSCMGLIKT